MRAIVFDSSTIISISDSCLMHVLGRLEKETGIEFLIPVGVERETVLTPLKIRRFELSAVRVKEAIEDGWIRVAREGKETLSAAARVMNAANSVFYAQGKSIPIIQQGEAETIALAKSSGAEAIAIDERTTRMLFEDPHALRSFMEYKYAEKIELDERRLGELNAMFRGASILRSTELIAMAFELGLFGPDLGSERRDLEAALFALKYHGCAVSGKEIEDFVKTK